MRRTACSFAILMMLASGGYAAGSDEGGQAAWRPLPLIENGKVSPHWVQVGWGRFVVDGDSLRTECDERGMGLLVYRPERFGNCQLRVVYRGQNARSNAGVFIRMDEGILAWANRPSVAVQRDAQGKLSQEMLQKLMQASEAEEGAWYAVHHGYEVQISDAGDAFHRTGAIYSLSQAEPLDKAAGEWRTMVITLDGSRVSVAVDGKQLSSVDPDGKDVPARKNWTEPKRDAKRPQVGYIGLQNHDPGDVVYFKEVSVRPLAAVGKSVGQGNTDPR